MIAGLDQGDRLELAHLRRLATSACVCEQVRSSESALYGRREEASAAHSAEADETDYVVLACLLGDPHVYELRADLVSPLLCSFVRLNVAFLRRSLFEFKYLM